MKKWLLTLLVLLVIGVVSTGGCFGQETPTQIIEDITPQEAFTLIQDNQNNPDFIILVQILLFLMCELQKNLPMDI